MPSSYRALCSDFYVNQKLNVKLDLPRSRETVLDLFERVRREYPDMRSFKRYKDEVALESPQDDGAHRWIAIRSNSIRSGVVNPQTEDDAYGLHRCVLEVAPYFLSISPLDLEYVELLYGFDLASGGNHDAIVAEALMGSSPMSSLVDVPGARAVDCQPLIGLTLGKGTDVEAHFEVKTRSAAGAREVERRDEPISVYLTLRQFEPVADLRELPDRFDRLAKRGQELVDERVLPALLTPIREAIATNNL